MGSVVANIHLGILVGGKNLCSLCIVVRDEHVQHFMNVLSQVELTMLKISPSITPWG